MRKNNCKLIRRELDELMLGEAWSSAATEHLRECASCREFHEQQTKLRQIVGSLGTVEAPADFDFRLRARLANGTSAPSIYWAFVRRGLAVAAMVIVIATGAVVVRNVLNQPAKVEEVAQRPEVHLPVKADEPAPVVRQENKPEQVVAGVGIATIRRNRPTQIDYKKRPLATRDSAFGRAEVLNGAEPVGVSPAFPIDASVQSFTVSLDDGRGNAKTISVPTISFGSQRIVQSGNAFAPKRDW
jgi:hypothetical protein